MQDKSDGYSLKAKKEKKISITISTCRNEF